MILETWARQNGHLETAAEHLWHKTWPQGTIVTFTSLLRQTLHTHAALATSASLEEASAFSWKTLSNLTIKQQLFPRQHQFTIYTPGSTDLKFYYSLWANNLHIQYVHPITTGIYPIHIYAIIIEHQLRLASNNLMCVLHKSHI